MLIKGAIGVFHLIDDNIWLLELCQHCFRFMACCPMTPSHYPHWHWIFIIWGRNFSFTSNALEINSWLQHDGDTFDVTDTSISSPFYEHICTSIPAWMNNYIHFKVWDETFNPFPNINGCTVEDWEWISSFIPHFTVHVITDPCWD